MSSFWPWSSVCKAADWWHAMCLSTRLPHSIRHFVGMLVCSYNTLFRICHRWLGCSCGAAIELLNVDGYDCGAVGMHSLPIPKCALYINDVFVNSMFFWICRSWWANSSMQALVCKKCRRRSPGIPPATIWDPGAFFLTATSFGQMRFIVFNKGACPSPINSDPYFKSAYEYWFHLITSWISCYRMDIDMHGSG